MKIHFKQQGGAMPPYLAYTPFVPQSTESPSFETSSETISTTTSKKDSLDEKDLMEMISEIDGLPNEMEVVINNLKNMYSMQELFPQGTSGLVNLYLNSLYRLKVAGYNMKEFDNAYDRVVENTGLSEVAITSGGQIVVADRTTGELGLMDVKNYLNNTDENKTALTNSNLLYYRSHMPQYSFDSTLLPIVENGIGMEKVSKLIDQSLTDLGSTKQSMEYSFHQQNGKIVKGAEVLKELQSKNIPVNTSIDGLYEGKYISETEAQQAKEAIKYIYQALPKNAQTLLQIKGNNNTNPEEGALNIISSVVLAGASNSVESDVSYKGGVNPDGTKQSSESGDNLKYNVAAQWLMGVGQNNVFTIQDGTKDGIAVHSTSLPITSGDTLVGANSTLTQLSKSDFGGILDLQNVSMGGLMISTTGLDKILTTDGQAYKINMPIDKEAASKGIIKPDLRFLRKKEQADAELAQEGVDIKTNKNRVNQVYQEMGLPILYDAEGNLNITDYTTFMVLNGIAINTAFSTEQPADITFNDYLKELTDEEEENALNIFKTIDKNLKYDEKSLWNGLWGSHDSIYRGTIYIPVKSHVLNALASKLPADAILTIEAKEQAKDRIESKANNFVNGDNLRE